MTRRCVPLESRQLDFILAQYPALSILIMHGSIQDLDGAPMGEDIDGEELDGAPMVRQLFLHMHFFGRSP